MNKKHNDPADGSDSDKPSGRVTFDDRGNAVWETWRGRALEHPALELADEQPPRNTLKTNGGGLKSGYNPYDSGMLCKKPERRKKDLRALSKWIESKNSHGED